MNLAGLKPIFDEATMKQVIKEFRNGQRAVSSRAGIAVSIFNGMLSAPKMLDIYRNDAREAVMKSQHEQMRVSAVTNGKVQEPGYTAEEAEAIKSTTFASMIRDAYMLTDQILAADKYIEPGSRLIIPMTSEEIPNADQDKIDLAAG